MRNYVFLGFSLVCLVMLPSGLVNRLKGGVIAGTSSYWTLLGELKKKWDPLQEGKERNAQNELEIARLKEENRSMRTQLEQMRNWLLDEDRLDEQFERLKGIQRSEDSGMREWLTRRNQELVHRLRLGVHALPAKVIFRDPATWSSSLWIDVGHADNRRCGKSVIAENSPVLFNGSLVGVIEWVEEKQSRIRLITDSRLHLSVRAVRGDLMLAKGEVYGKSLPLWRSQNLVLQGSGFNYDFADREGGAKDLRTGQSYRSLKKGNSHAILQEGDLLITTGFDRVFPEGLRVAEVSKVESLKEGASSYDIEAVPTGGNLDEMMYVLVLPAR